MKTRSFEEVMDGFKRVLREYNQTMKVDGWSNLSPQETPKDPAVKGPGFYSARAVNVNKGGAYGQLKRNALAY